MEKIYSKQEPWLLLHTIIRGSDFKPGRQDVIPAEQFLQVSILNMENGKTFKPHRHIVKDFSMLGMRTQESWVVIRGKVEAILYDIDDKVLARVILHPGDASVTLMGGHNYISLEPYTLVYEFKTGPYEGQEKDKVFI